MNLSRLLFTASVCAANVVALAQYPQAWSSFRDVGLRSSEQALKTLNAPGGGFYLYGVAASGSQSLTKVTASGQILWNRISPGRAIDVATGTGGTVVVGIAPHYPNSSLVAAKYDASGTLLWTKNFKSGVESLRVAMDGSGNAIVGAGASVMKLSASTGSPIWTTPVTGQTKGVSIDSAGNVFVVGTSTPNGVATVTLTKLDPSGPSLWSKSSPATNPYILLDKVGNSYLVQGVTISLTANVQVTKYDLDGIVQWAANSPAAVPVGATITPSNAIVTVSSGAPGLTLTRFTSAGGVAWSRSNATYAPDGIALNELTSDPSENAYICAATVAGPQDAELIRYDPSGNFRWARGEVGTANIDDQGRSAVIDPIGRIVFLSRVVNTGTATDLRVASYDTAGNRIWGTDVDLGRSDDKAIGAVTDSAGNTYVLGTGVTSDASATPTFSIIKVGSNANVLWSHAIGAIGGPLSEMLPPQLAPGGGVVLVQRAHNALGMRGTIYRYDTNGALTWTFTSFPGSQFLIDYKVAADNSVLLALTNGTSNGMGGLNNTNRLTKISAAGALLGSTDQPGETTALPTGINIDPNGSTYIVYSHKVSSNFQMALSKFDFNGAFLWASSVARTSVVQNFPHSDVLFDSAGNPCFLGDLTVFKYNPAGTLIWSRTPTNQARAHIAIDAQDHIFCMGINTFDNAGYVSRIDVNSAVPWTTKMPFVPQFTGFDFIPDNTGGVVVGVTAVTDEGGNSVADAKGYDYQILRVDNLGAIVWKFNSQPFYAGIFPTDAAGLDNRSAAFAQDAAGNMYFAGAGYGPGGTADLNVVKYNGNDATNSEPTAPSSMIAGQTYLIGGNYTNTGIQTWTTAAGYRIVFLNSAAWGVSNGFLDAATKSVPTGKSGSFFATVVAPSVPGTYTYQTKMYQSGQGSFGLAGPIKSVNVTVAADAARIVSCDCPTVDFSGTVTVHVDMLNVGTTTWTAAGGYFLTNPQNAETIYNPHQLDPSDSISPGGHKVFTFQISSDIHKHQVGFQMCHGSTRFGDAFRATIN